MRVLIAADYFAPNSGNFIGSLYDLALYMHKFNDELIFVFPNASNTRKGNNWTSWLETSGCTVYLIDKGIPIQEQLDFLNDIIIKERIDILHIHFGLFHNLAMHNRKKLKCKIIVHEHMEYPAGCNKYEQSIKFMLRSLYYRTKRIGIISVNKQVDKAHFFARHWFVPNGLSFKRNIVSSKTREEKREEYGFKDDEKVILFLGWDLHRKGLDIAIKTVAKLREDGNNVILTVAGVGERTHIAEHVYNYIIEKTGIDPMTGWIRYISGGEDMFAAHRAADVYLSASRSEAFSYGILEAISENKPVVVSDIKGTSWCWEYNKSFTYPVEDVKACANAISNALLVSDNSSNYKDVVNKYSIEEWCDKIYNVYQYFNKS